MQPDPATPAVPEGSPPSPGPAGGGWLARLDEWVHRGEKAVLCVVLVLMIAVVFVDFALRELKLGGLAWSKAAATYAMVWVGFLGSSLATRGRKHLKVDASEKMVPRRFHPHVGVLVGVVAAGFCFYMMVLGLRVSARSFLDGKVSPVMNFPVGVVEAAIPTAFLLMGLRFLLRDALGSLRQMLAGGTAKPSPSGREGA